MRYTLDSLNLLSDSLDATGVLSPEYRTRVVGLALSAANEAAKQERTKAAKLLTPGDTLQSAASRLVEWVLQQEGVPYETHMAALEARGAVAQWTEARRP